MLVEHEIYKRKPASDNINNPWEYYPTPEWCYENLNIDWSLFKTAHEPGAGDGRLVKFLKEKGLDVSYTEISEGKNFFEWDGKVDLILGGPPFHTANFFIEHALERCDTCIYLLRTGYLHGKKRYDFWKKHPPTALHILSSQPNFEGLGKIFNISWYVWDKTNKLDKGIFFIPEEK